MIRALKHFVREIRKPRPASAASFQRRLDILARAHLKTANDARDDARYEIAADQYAAYLRIRPGDAAIHVQHGNMLGHLDDLSGAESAFRTALKIAPTADTRLQLGRVLARQNRQAEAVEALVAALHNDPEMTAVREELVALGARLLVPRRRDQPGSLVATPWQASGRAVRSAGPMMPNRVYPLKDYDRFRKERPVVPAPVESDETVRVVLDALCECPARLRATLLSVLEQDHAAWRVVVITTPDILEHPVAALGRSDARIEFRLQGEAHPDDAEAVTVSLSAGTVLDPEGLGWLIHAQALTGVSAVYADHDHRIDHWRDGPTFIDPVLHPMPDLEDLRTTWRPPAVVIFDRPMCHVLLAELGAREGEPNAGAQARRHAVMACVTGGSAAHLPLVLASATDLPAVADRARAGDDERGAGWLEPEPCAPPSLVNTVPEPRQITVIIPTRDEADLLETCVLSLMAQATHPERIAVIIADNRSREPATAALLDRLAIAGAEVLTVDEPFNWSRINNLAARDRGDGALLFLNNDTQMLTTGWDEILCGHLERGAGAVGARLLYPDHRVQHAGMIFGMDNGPPRHEGVDAGATDGGPGGRWRRSHASAAVTGAFLAVSTDLFRLVGGFEDVAMAVGYSDVDFCLKVRRAGRPVIYAADIELIHYESRSRGRNETRTRVAWDQGELTSLRKRWGAALDIDPGYNPAWDRRATVPFEALAAPDPEEVLRWLTSSATGRPWDLP